MENKNNEGQTTSRPTSSITSEVRPYGHETPQQGQTISTDYTGRATHIRGSDGKEYVRDWKGDFVPK